MDSSEAFGHADQRCSPSASLLSCRDSTGFDQRRSRVGQGGCPARR
jgi:hypothetical protein